MLIVKKIDKPNQIYSLRPNNRAISSLAISFNEKAASIAACR
jgi:hypothetical protein